MIVVRRTGFYLWLGSFLVVAVGHYLVAEWGSSRARLACGAIFVLMVVGVLGLERAFPVGVSALEATTKYPDDVSALANALAQHPSQADKDVTLYWVVVQEVAAHPDRGDLPRVRQLIAAGANVNQGDRYGQTLLMRAVGRHADSLVRILVQAGADVNARDWRGKTVLDIAREAGSPQSQKILIDSGAHEGATGSGQDGG